TSRRQRQMCIRDRVTGDDCFIARLQVRSMEQLDTLLDRINGYAETNTAIVKKSPVKRRLPPMT
ncbi:Lrp/AsnC family transcriptional regulator, partial [Pseudomonas aeruginosa]|nr:Lrp/AsnC family transcriptional regulator [Pseudomonas aeruginosa]